LRRAVLRSPVDPAILLPAGYLIAGRLLTYLKVFFHRERLLNAMKHDALYFRLLLIWLALLVTGFAFVLC
jgi:hypothetical protein